MSRHTLGRPFDQKRFDELKQRAQTALSELNVFNCGSGKIHNKNVIIGKLRARLRAIEKRGEYYSYIYRGLGVSKRIYYTLDTLEEIIEKANRFLGG